MHRWEPAGIFFTAYESLLSHTGSAVISSSLAEVCSCAIITPAEVIKQNAQVLSARALHPYGRTVGSVNARLVINSSSLQALRRIPKIAHLWRGYTTLVGRNLPFTAMQFPVFEALKKRLLDRESGPLWTGVSAGVSAGAAGCIAAVITTPVDVVKTKVMLSAGQRGGGSGAGGERNVKGVRRWPLHRGRKSALTVAKDVVREEGWRGLMRGGALRGAWTAVGSGLYLGSYEAAKVWLRKGREEAQESIAI